jgi:hypothetical protein
MGGKAMLVLASLASQPELLHVLRALLQPKDYACLVRIAHKAVSTSCLHCELHYLCQRAESLRA